METTEKLPKEFKRKWVKALRSGKYKQGHQYLHSATRNTWCCLGVACAITGAEPKIKTWINKDVAPKVPANLHGNRGIPEELADLNDDYVPFEVIAGVINEYL